MPPYLLGNFKLAFETDGHIMRRSSRFLPFEYRNTWRPVAPVAAHPAAGDDVHVEVWCVLSCNDTVILNEIQAFRIVRSDESVGHPSHGPHDGDCLVFRQVEQGWSVAPSGNENLAQLELLPVDHSYCLLRFLDDRLALTSGNCLAKKARIARSWSGNPTRAAWIGRYLNGQCEFL